MLGRSKVWYQTPSTIIFLLLPTLLIYPSLNQLHLSTTSLMQYINYIFNHLLTWSQFTFVPNYLSTYLPIYNLTYAIYQLYYLLTWSQSTLMESYLEDTLSWLSYPDFTPKKILLLDQNLLSNQLQLMAWPLHLHAPSTNCP